MSVLDFVRSLGKKTNASDSIDSISPEVMSIAMNNVREHFIALDNALLEVDRFVSLLDAPQVPYVKGVNIAATTNGERMQAVRVVYDRDGKPLCANIVDERVDEE